MISNRTFIGYLKQFIVTIIRYLSFIQKILLRKNPRFLVLSFGIFKHQSILDLHQMKIFRVLTPTVQDFRVLLQIFHFEHYKIDLEWKKILEESNAFMNDEARLILDLGSNIGLSALYFSLTIPNAEIVLVEPSNRNMEIARQNTRGLKCHYVNGAIASGKSRISLVDPGLGPDSYRVCMEEDGLIETYTVNEILNSFNSTPYLVKIDIEGSELNLFDANTNWIDTFPLLIIELHDWLLLNQFVSRNFLLEIGKRSRNFIFRNENIFSF